MKRREKLRGGNRGGMYSLYLSDRSVLVDLFREVGFDLLPAIRICRGFIDLCSVVVFVCGQGDENLCCGVLTFQQVVTCFIALFIELVQIYFYVVGWVKDIIYRERIIYYFN